MSDTDSTCNAVIVGQGYVGLPLAIAAVEAGHDVTGVDHSAAVVDRINAAHSPVADISDERLAAAIATGRFRADATMVAVGAADVIVLCVPTPYHDEAPDLSYIQSAGAAVAAELQPGSLVILESTTYPGTTEEVLGPVLEEGSGLVAGKDFELAFSPERIDPGNPDFGVHNTPKIVGGTTPSATARAASFYGSFVEQVVEVSGPRTAETAKLLENTFRHINIALVNELAILCQGLEVDVWEVIEAAATKPFGFMPFFPGPGVGGHCIPVDPMYLSWRVRQFGGAAKFIDLARDVNAAMPQYCVSRVQDLLNERRRSLNGARLLVVGVAYKRNVPDMREAPSVPLLTALLEKGAEVDVLDPHVPEVVLPDGRRVPSIGLADLDASQYDCAIIVTAHDAVDHDAIADACPLVFDTRKACGRGHPSVVRL